MKHLLKRFILLYILFSLFFSYAIAEETFSSSTFVYGHSELGRDLICHRVGEEDAAQTLLMVFGVHGFEDAFERDGEVLKLIAQNIIAYYTLHPEDLKDFNMYVIPCANPDGLIDGYTNDGFGRCNANGIDINRDFPFDWEEDTSSRNRTGEAPLAAAETRAICALVEQICPDYGVDVHGWKKASYGNGKMAEVFARPFRFKVKRLSTVGMLGAWLHSVTKESILFELPPFPDKEDYVEQNSVRLIEGINDWLALCSTGR